MAETLLSFGVEKLWDLLTRETERFQGVEEQFNELKRELEMLRCYLKDAEANKQTFAMVRNTSKEIEDIVYDAEDTIETFLLKQELGKTSGIKKQIKQLACVIADRRKIALDMEAISKRINSVIRKMLIPCIQQVNVSERTIQSPQDIQREMRQAFSSEDEDHPVGLKKNVDQLVGYLVKEDGSQVVSITGMPGIGKTTLAKQVFNHAIVKSHFAGLAWVCVSQQFRRKYVWQTILRKLCPEYKESDMTEEELQEKLVQVLETQNTLIVLDDIWREDDWDRIKAIFPRKKGWRLLLTSRNEGVGLRADPTCFTFKPDCLTPEESWTLFQRIVFPSENTTEYKFYEEMEEMGKQMIEQCGGLPLSVKVLGGLLAAEYTLHRWKRIYANIRSHIVGGTSFNERNINSVYHALYLSFEELPGYLKHGFLYLAHFPEDYPIDVEKLSYYWDAERIIRPMHYEGATTREVADGYIEELVKRNMVISKKDVSTSRFETCHLHDMMREVCLRKAEEENFVHILDTSHVTSTATSQSSFKSRRLAIHLSDDTSTHMEAYIQNPRLRSLLFIKQSLLLNWMESGLCITKLQLMRILDLSYVKFERGKLPSDIGKLIHLRYLSLYLAKVSHLPSSMRNLRKLLYLNLGVAAGSPIYMPNFCTKMRELTFLLLPDDMEDKTKLELGNLTNLETLENFSTKHSSVRDLHGMKRLTTLSILLNGEGCTPETLSSLGELGHLESLTIRNHKSDKKEYVLDGIHGKKLKSIQVEQHFPSHLTTISLRHCYLTEDPMPILEKLLHLKEVCLGERSFCGKKMVCSSSGFPQLQKLSLHALDEWEGWIVEEGSMPLLHTLEINRCQKLNALPDGLRFITSLKELTIITTEREFTEKLSKGGEDYYKVQHIPLLSIPVYDMYSSDEECLLIDYMVCDL
ncbi:unnamed protein product [Arabidopsis halleri]